MTDIINALQVPILMAVQIITGLAIARAILRFRGR